MQDGVPNTSGRTHLAFVVPRYGDIPAGGAEVLARRVAEKLVSRGLARVTVLTTCASDLAHWRNDLPPGSGILNGVDLIRFPVDHELRDLQRYDKLLGALLSDAPLTLGAQADFIHNHVHTPELYVHLRQNRVRYDLTIFMPYPFGTTFYGSLVHPPRSILWPLLHDEPLAHALITRLMLERCRGVIFSSEPERELAAQLDITPRDCRIVGIGFDAPAVAPARFRQKYGVEGPFILYAGRFDPGKGVDRLLRFFESASAQLDGNPALILIGPDQPFTPAHPRARFLGFLPEQDRYDAMAASLALVQPSRQESFSMVLFEAWLCGAPVLVDSASRVPSDFVDRSRGGLAYTTEEDFVNGIRLLMRDPSLRERLARNGAAFAASHYNWDIVLQRFMSACEAWMTTENTPPLIEDEEAPASPAAYMRVLRERILHANAHARDELDRITYLKSLEGLVAQVERASALREFEFSSPTPVIGPLLRAVRAGVHAVAGKWVERSLIQQQFRYNTAASRALDESLQLNERLLARIEALEKRVAELEREKNPG